MRIEVLYFARLRELAGVEREHVDSEPTTPALLYRELRARYGFPFDENVLRVSVDGEFAPWDAPLSDGTEVVFLPPVSGG